LLEEKRYILIQTLVPQFSCPIGVHRSGTRATFAQLRQEEDHQPTSRIHRDYMPVVMEKHGAIPSRANMGDLLQDTGTIPPP
jgi:hypothetical protein